MTEYLRNTQRHSFGCTINFKARSSISKVTATKQINDRDCRYLRLRVLYLTTAWSCCNKLFPSVRLST